MKGLLNLRDALHGKQLYYFCVRTFLPPPGLGKFGHKEIKYMKETGYQLKLHLLLLYRTKICRWDNKMRTREALKIKISTFLC